MTGHPYSEPIPFLDDQGNIPLPPPPEHVPRNLKNGKKSITDVQF